MVGLGYRNTPIVLRVLYWSNVVDGFLVVNERDLGKTDRRWGHSTNTLYTQQPTEKFPDLYLTKDVSMSNVHHNV